MTGEVMTKENKGHIRYVSSYLLRPGATIYRKRAVVIVYNVFNTTKVDVGNDERVSFKTIQEISISCMQQY